MRPGRTLCWLGMLTGLVLAQSSYELGEAAWRQAVASGKIKLSRHQAASLRVQQVGARLAAVTRRPVAWHFYLVAGEDINAFTVGEGFVAVTEGLLGLGLDDQELAGVLAHEIAHGTEQHLLADVNNQRWLEQAQREMQEAQALQRRYEQEYQASGDSASYESKLATVRRRLSSAQKRLDYLAGQERFAREFNHEQEMVADQVGIRYAVTAGYEAEGLMRALRKIRERGVERFGERYSGAGQTHPPLERRIQVLERVYQNWLRQGWRR